MLEPGKLGANAHRAMAEAEARASIFVPAIVLVEMRYLVEKGRITEEVFEFVSHCLADPKAPLEIAVLDLENARAVGNIARKIVPDMPDRIIAATALQLGLPLITCDKEITASGIPVIW